MRGDVIKGMPPDSFHINNGIIEFFRAVTTLLKIKGFCKVYYLHILMETLEVIGNIHDNPELIKAGA